MSSTEDYNAFLRHETLRVAVLQNYDQAMERLNEAEQDKDSRSLFVSFCWLGYLQKNNINQNGFDIWYEQSIEFANKRTWYIHKQTNETNKQTNKQINRQTDKQTNMMINKAYVACTMMTRLIGNVFEVVFGACLVHLMFVLNHPKYEEIWSVFCKLLKLWLVFFQKNVYVFDSLDLNENILVLDLYNDHKIKSMINLWLHFFVVVVLLRNPLNWL